MYCVLSSDIQTLNICTKNTNLSLTAILTDIQIQRYRYLDPVRHKTISLHVSSISVLNNVTQTRILHTQLTILFIRTRTTCFDLFQIIFTFSLEQKSGCSILLHNKELYALYSLTVILRVITPRRLRWKVRRGFLRHLVKCTSDTSNHVQPPGLLEFRSQYTYFNTH